MQHEAHIACRNHDAMKLPPPCGEGWGGGLRISAVTHPNNKKGRHKAPFSFRLFKNLIGP